MGRDLKFPDPDDYPPNTQTVNCNAERVLGLYNQDSGASAQRISETVRRWFTAKALEKGWRGVNWPKDVGTGYGSGCVLLSPHGKISSSQEEDRPLIR